MSLCSSSHTYKGTIQVKRYLYAGVLSRATLIYTTHSEKNDIIGKSDKILKRGVICGACFFRYNLCVHHLDGGFYLEKQIQKAGQWGNCGNDTFIQFIGAGRSVDKIKLFLYILLLAAHPAVNGTWYGSKEKIQDTQLKKVCAIFRTSFFFAEKKR